MPRPQVDIRDNSEVTRTVRDLLLGSRIELEERGTHALKGVPGEWELFAVSNAGAGT